MSVVMGAARRVLLVEDNAGDADLIRDLLLDGSEWMEDVRHVTRVADALESLGAGDVDAVLLDLGLPDATGLACVRKVRARAGNVPIVVLTGTDDEELAVSCIKAGAQDYVSKQAVTAQTLRRAISYARARVREREARHRADLAESAARDATLAAERAQSQLSLLIHQLPLGIWVTDESLRVQSRLGVSLSPLDSMAIEVAQGKEPAGAVLHAHRQALVKGECRFEYVEGERSYEGVVKRTSGLNGAPATSIVGMAIDITDRKELELQFRQAQKMEAVGRLAGGVAHDFSNLLTAIISFGGFVLETLSPADPAHQDQVEVLEAARRAEHLTRQLLAFSRKQPVHRQVVGLNTLLGKVDRMLRRIVGEDVELRAALREGLWNVAIDPGLFEQVVVNLVVNARDAMPDGGVLTIKTDNVQLEDDHLQERGADLAGGEYVVLSVSDNGSGMDPDTRRNIFEPFFTTKLEGRGTGLGLSTCYGIVKQARGHITVRSEPGRGSTFEVYLPRAYEDAKRADTHIAPTLRRGHEKILVVEDDAQVRRVTRRALEKYGYAVMEAESGGDAFLICEQTTEPIHLLLTDVMMPRMSGKELADRVASLHPETRVLFMSGYTSDAIVRHGVLDEGTHLVSKPFTPAILVQKVREVLDTAR